MLQTLAITGPIYLVIGLGWLAVRFGPFERLEMRVLGKYVVNFALPALVFTALSQRSVTDILNPRYLVGYAAGSLAVMLTSFSWGRFRQGKSIPLSTFCGLGMASSNSGFIGLPIAAQVVGADVAAVTLAMCMLVENLLMIPLALAMADADAPGERWHRTVARSAAQVARHPVVLAMVAGIAVASIGIQVSPVLARTINVLATSSMAVSLFVIGGSLVGLETRGMRRDVSVVASAKLLLHPLAVGTLMWLWPPGDTGFRAAAVIFASVPMLSIYPVLAQKYGLEAFCAAALLLATTLSFVTINAILWLLGSVLYWAP